MPPQISHFVGYQPKGNGDEACPSPPDSFSGLKIDDKVDELIFQGERFKRVGKVKKDE